MATFGDYIAGHLGRDKTVQKVTERFYWKTVWTDVHHLIRECLVCQQTNDAKFVKSNSSLHPIPVKSKVWSQVLQVVSSKFQVINEILLMCAVH